MNIPALTLQTGEDEEGQSFEIIFSAKGWASPPTLHNRAAQGLDVRHLPTPSSCGRGEVFSLDIPFYRPRQLLGEAISKIQSGTVAARFPEVAINLMRYLRLRFVDRLNRDLRWAAWLTVSYAPRKYHRSRSREP